MNEKPTTDDIYLDYNATTPVLDTVREAMIPYLDGKYGNPSSNHSYGKEAARAVEEARRRVASLIGAASEEIVFTSGGTESNNLALKGYCRSLESRGRISTSSIEHPAVESTCRRLAEYGWSINVTGVRRDGRLDVDTLSEKLKPQTEVVSVMHANNETGVIQPVAKCVELADDIDAVVHTDAAQSVGKIPVNVDTLGVDLLTIAGHKLYAPKGIGALYIRGGISLDPVLDGASHERGLRPGTEPVPAIVGLGKACEVASRTLEEAMSRIEKLRDRLWKQLRNQIPELSLNGHPSKRLPNTLNICFPDVRGDRLLEEASDIAASTGSACHEGKTLQASEVLREMGIAPAKARGAVRLSLGRQTTSDDIQRTADILVQTWRKLSK